MFFCVKLLTQKIKVTNALIANYDGKGALCVSLICCRFFVSFETAERGGDVGGGERVCTHNRNGAARLFAGTRGRGHIKTSADSNRGCVRMLRRL